MPPSHVQTAGIDRGWLYRPESLKATEVGRSAMRRCLQSLKATDRRTDIQSSHSLGIPLPCALGVGSGAVDPETGLVTGVESVTGAQATNRKCTGFGSCE